MKTQRLLILLSIFLLAACAPGVEELAEGAGTEVASQPAAGTAFLPEDPFSDIPAAARLSSRAGDPRPPAYWALWNTCAAENRAETAAANGGRAAGWYLVDDFIADPGLQLGEYRLDDCAAALVILQGAMVSGMEASLQVQDLAAALLAAELNLNAGAETCPIAEEAVLGSQLVLSEVGFKGDFEDIRISPEIMDALLRLLALVEGYNRGELCR